MADIAEDSLLDIEDSAEMVKLNGVVHDKEEGEVVKNTMLHCLSALLSYLLTYLLLLNRQTDGKTSVTDLKNFKVLTFELASTLCNSFWQMFQIQVWPFAGIFEYYNSILPLSLATSKANSEIRDFT